MPPYLDPRGRRQDTAVALRSLRAELADWLARRRTADELGQYTSQFAALETILGRAADVLEQGLARVDVTRGPGEVWEELRLADLRIAWLRRVWQFFREKLDQRDDPRPGPLLAAADPARRRPPRPASHRAPADG